MSVQMQTIVIAIGIAVPAILLIIGVPAFLRWRESRAHARRLDPRYRR